MSMTPPTPDVPISELNYDLLWNIFCIISSINFSKYDRVPAGTRRHSSLTTTRVCSQVCTSWRDLVLNSPSLWGNCIDLDFLRQEHGNWRNEVLERTGNALLSVYSANEIVKLQTNVHAFLMDLILIHWERVQFLDVVVESVQIFDDGRAWRAFTRPAPNLKVFSMGFHDSGPTTSSTPRPIIYPNDFRLFSDDAPVLTGFSLFADHEVIIPFRTRPLPSIFLTTQIRNLRLCHAVEIEASEILIACKQMPYLETLGVRIAPNSMRSTSTHSVSLLRLGMIEIIVRSLDVYGFLGHIIAHPGCVLRLSTFLDTIDGLSTPTPTINANIREMQEVVSRYTVNFFDRLQDRPNWVTQLTLSFDLNSIDFRTYEHGFGCHLERLPFRTQAIPYNNTKSMVNVISSLKFPDTIVQLNLHLFRISADLRLIRSSTQSIADDHQSMLSSLFQLFSSLGSVVRLDTSASTLRSLIHLSNLRPYTLFPLLKDLYLYRGYIIGNDLDCVKSFLALRKHTPPLETLDLTDYLPMNSPQDLQYLDGYIGLKVVRLCNGQRTEYICGGGNPEMLYLRESWRD